MQIDVVHSLLLIAVMSLVTMFTRFLPFIVFRNADKTPKILLYLGRVLPGAIMGMLIIYCFRSTAVFSWPFALPEIIASGVVVGLYLWKKNILLSVGVGTVLYMVLVQTVFA